jgi:signal transduction histidine kinase
MNSLKQLNGKIILGIIAASSLILALIWINYVHQREEDKNDTITSAIRRNSNLVIALEQYTIRTIHNADAVLQLVRLKYQAEGQQLNIDKLLFENAISKQAFSGIAIMDEKGYLTNSNINAPYANVNFSDRTYFQYHALHNDDSLLISKPVVSRTIHHSVIIISRRVNDVNGNFKGVVAVQIDPSTFTSFYAQANLNKYDIISLIAPDGITYARRWGNIESSGENIIKSPLFKHLKSNPDSFYFAKDAIHGIPTYFSYRKLKQYPMIATVGISENDVLNDYYKRGNRDLFFAIMLSIMVLIFVVFLCIILTNRKMMLNRMVEDEKRHQQQVTEQVIAAQEREREVIGRELHDNVNQVLTTVKLYLETTLHKKETSEKLIPKCIDLVMESIKEIRNLSRELSAPTIGTKSLVDSIEALIEMVATSSHLQLHFDHKQYQKLPCMNQKLAFYRIIQEQLNNIVKHADAKNVWIRLYQEGDTTVLSIKDDGKGFNLLEKRTGIGLNNITSRAEVFNGSVDIKSSRGRGCQLLVTIPTNV